MGSNAILDYSLEAGEQEEEEEEDDRHPQQHYYRTRPVDVAEILVSPVPVTYVVSSKRRMTKHDGGDDNDEVQQQQAEEEEEEKMAMFWVVMLRTRKCYSFNQHLQCMINELDREDKSRLQKAANREYEDVMNMMREVFLFQYKNSPSVIEHLKRQGVGSRVEPFQRLIEVGTPDSLDTVCSVYEAYRSIVQQCSEAGNYIFSFSFLAAAATTLQSKDAMLGPQRHAHVEGPLEEQLHPGLRDALEYPQHGVCVDGAAGLHPQQVDGLDLVLVDSIVQARHVLAAAAACLRHVRIGPGRFIIHGGIAGQLAAFPGNGEQECPQLPSKEFHPSKPCLPLLHFVFGGVCVYVCSATRTHIKIYACTRFIAEYPTRCATLQAM